MDAEEFDVRTRSVAGLRTRRRALLTLAGSLGLIRFAGHDDALASPGKCPTYCDECAPCKKGTCKKVNGKLRCTKGKCKPKPDTTPCSGGTCYGGTCTAPFPSPLPYCASKNFCPIATTPPTCQASGAQCVCAANVGGQPVCVLEAGMHFVTICSLCNPGEICLDATGCPGKVSACALPCPAPI